LGMAVWTTYMPTGSGTMMLLAAIILPGTSWRAVWLVASAASLLMLLALLLGALPRRELDRGPASHQPVLADMTEVATSGGPLAIALCFGAYACCWFAVIGFLPTLQIERLGFSTSTAAILTALPVHAPRPPLAGATAGLLMQGSSVGSLLGPPITGALVASGGWPAAAWLTSVALGIAAAAGLFLHWREKRKLAA